MKVEPASPAREDPASADDSAAQSDGDGDEEGRLVIKEEAPQREETPPSEPLKHEPEDSEDDAPLVSVGRGEINGWLCWSQDGGMTSLDEMKAR